MCQHCMYSGANIISQRAFFFERVCKPIEKQLENKMFFKLGTYCLSRHRAMAFNPTPTGILKTRSDRERIPLTSLPFIRTKLNQILFEQIQSYEKSSCKISCFGLKMTS